MQSEFNIQNQNKLFTFSDIEKSRILKLLEILIEIDKSLKEKNENNKRNRNNTSKT
jgi:hypothetical protein